ncbi:MAG: hypothetical protein ACTSWY_02320 [Promethearchaeota archaeon]
MSLDNLSSRNSNSNNNNNNNRSNETQPISKFQVIVYILGLILVMTSFVEFFYGNSLRGRITGYEEVERNTIMLRNNLQDLQRKYDEAWFDLLELDFNSWGNVEYLEADLTETYLKLLKNLLKSTNLWYNFKDLYVKSYASDDIQWLFTEGVFTLWYYRNVTTIETKMADILIDVNAFYSGITEEDLTNWDIQWITPSTLDFAFNYVYTGFIYNETFEAYEDTLEARAGYVEIHFDIFDYHIRQNYSNPKDEDQRRLELIGNSANANTLGILVLCCLLDLGTAHRKLKSTYIILSIISVIAGLFFSIIIFQSGFIFNFNFLTFS